MTRLLLNLVVLIVAAVPGGIVGTWMLYPFWSLLEASTGIESVGHSGPAEWCYFTVFSILVAVGAIVIVVRHKRRPDA